MFHAIVCIKQVPDTSNIRIDPETGNLIRKGIPTILNPYDEHALAAAVEWKRKVGGRITVISMGPPSVVTSIRECIELGADRGVLLSARQFAGADTLATSYVLASAIEHINKEDPVDLVFFGKHAIDGDTAQVGPGVASRIGLPIVTYAVEIHEINKEEGYVIIERKTEARNEIIKVALPAAMTCEKEISEIPFASLPDLIESLKYEPEVWAAEGPIEFDVTQLGLKGSPTRVFKTSTPELHEAGEIIDTAEVGVQKAVAAVIEKMSVEADWKSILGVSQ